jgi:hypothetical protein
MARIEQKRQVTQTSLFASLLQAQCQIGLAAMLLQSITRGSSVLKSIIKMQSE